MSKIRSEYSIVKEIAKGVQMVMSNAALRVVIVADNIAQKYLSKSAIKLADREQDGTLAYPESDGRASIPMLELSSKGYINLHNEQMKEHFNTLVKAVPEYLRGRGILKPRKIQTMADKVNQEFREYISDIKYDTKKELIERSEEISAYRKINAFYSDPAFSNEKLGVLLSLPHIIDDTYQYITDNKLEPTNENFSKWVEYVQEHYEEVIQKGEGEYDYLKDKIEMFDVEMKMAKPIEIQTVMLKLEKADGTITEFNMDLAEFESYFADEMKESFALQMMLDFPNPNYYGTMHSDTYEKLLFKRFNENLKLNFNDLAPRGDVKLEIVGTSNQRLLKTALDDVQNTSYIRQYVKANYKDPNSFDKAFGEKLEKHTAMIKELNDIVVKHEQTKNTEVPKEVPQIDDETYIEETYVDETIIEDELSM